MRVGIVGAGVAGLVTARVLSRLGHDVVVWDRTPDVGGVWSRTRRYPGLSTQSPRDTYSFSEYPMPKTLPEWPSGEQVQQYLADYADHFDVTRLLRLGTEVSCAVPAESGGWELTVHPVGREADTSTEHIDHLVVANGVFCEPNLPAFDGVQDFVAAGGRVCAATDLHDGAEARGREVMVVGYGKSACDVAVAVADDAASTRVIARQLLWKVPRRVGGVLNFKYLLLTRMGEALFRYARLRGMEKFLHGPGNRMRRAMLNSVGTASKRQYRLARLDLVPAGSMEDIVRGAIGLVTDGFYERVADGRIEVRRDRVVKRLLEKDGAPHVELDDDTLLRADLLVCATGFVQGVPFLDEAVRARLLDDRGNFRLHRQIHPVDVADLSFAGYNSSFFSPLSAEMAAMWIAARLAGAVELADPDTLREQVDAQIAFMDSATGGHHCRATKVIPFTMHNVDEILGDLDLNIGRATRAAHWLNPVNPTAYHAVLDRLEKRLTAG